MPFQKGNKLAAGKKIGGRKGYEFEAQQMKKMNSILNKMLTLSERILGAPDDKPISYKDLMKYETLQKTFLKIMDKLHPNKQSIDVTTAGQSFMPSEEEKEKVRKALEQLK